MEELNPQKTFVTNFNADGQADGVELMTDERGHMYPISKLFSGNTLGDSMAVTPPAQAGMSVNINKGYIQIAAVSNPSDFSYLCWMEEDLSFTIASAGQSDARYSAIVAYVDTSKQYGESVTNNPGLMVIKEVAGEPGANPVEVSDEDIKGDAEIGRNKPFVVLAQVYVPAGAQTISAGNIVDKRRGISLSGGVGLAGGSYASGIMPGVGSSSQNSLQISVIDATSQVPSSTDSDILVCRVYP